MLPTNLIDLGYKSIRQATITPEELQPYVSYKEVKDLQDALKKFYAYFEKQWLKKFQDGEVSWYRLTEQTDNPLESFHHWVNLYSPKNPHPNGFISKYN